jgi:hypothetical protein
MQDYRKSQHRLGEVEAELAERVGELVSEIQGYQAREDKQLEELESFKKQLERAEQSMQTFKSRIEADFVSREQVNTSAQAIKLDFSITVLSQAHPDTVLACLLCWQVNEIERLYGESIMKLMNRVESLESRGPSASGPVSSPGVTIPTGMPTRVSSGPAAPVRRVQTQPSSAMQAGVRAMNGGSSSPVVAAAVAAAYPTSTRNRAAIQAGSSIAGAYGPPAPIGSNSGSSNSGASSSRSTGSGIPPSRTPDLLPRHPSQSDNRRAGGSGSGAAPSRVSLSAPGQQLMTSDSSASLSVGADELGMDLGEARKLLSALIGGAARGGP